MGTVVVGLDSSVASRAAFRAAITEAELRGHGVRAVHVYSFPVATIYQATMFDPHELRADVEAWIERELAELAETYEDGFPVAVEPVLTPGYAGSVLVEEAEDADLLVVGSRGLGGVRGMLLGSVSTYCAHHLKCPTLIVPAVGDDE